MGDEAIPATARRLLRREKRPPRNDSVIILALLAVAMTFSRLDTIFLALLAGAWILLRGTAMRTRLFLDAAVIVCAAFVSVAMRAGLPAYFEYARSAVLLAALGLAVQIPIFYVFGFYRSSTQITNYVLRFIFASLLSSALVASLMIGLLTPPVGMVLYVLTRVADISFEDCVKACAPFIVPLMFVLALITFVPWVTLWLPTLIFR